jgi:hypothetical protein
MYVRRLVADPQILSDLAQAELLGGHVCEALEGGTQEPRFKALFGGSGSCHVSPICFVDSVNLPMIIVVDTVNWRDHGGTTHD